MKIHGIQIGDTVFKAQEFGGEKFLKALKKRLQVGASPTDTEKGVDLILGYKPGTPLTGAEQVQVALALTNLHAKAIIEGEVLPEETGSVSNEERDALRNFAITAEDYIQEVQDILSNEEPQLLYQIGETEFGIYKTIDEGQVLYYIANIENPDNGEYGYIVTENGISFDQFNDTDFAYCMIYTRKGTEVWDGSIKKGFVRKMLLKNYTPTNLAIIKKGFICYYNNDLFYVHEIDSDTIIFSCGVGEIVEDTEFGNPIDIYNFGSRVILVYVGKDDSQEDVYFAVDEIGREIIRSHSYPYPIVTCKGSYFVIYSESEKRYYIANDTDGIITKSVLAFIDQDENGVCHYYFGGNVPNYILNAKGECSLHFIYEYMDSEGKITIHEGYIISGIETDIIETGMNKRPQNHTLFIMETPSAYTH